MAATNTTSSESPPRSMPGKDPSETSLVCPYALALDDNASEGSHDSDLLQATKQQCPAFKESCPFKNVQTAADVKQTLLKLPQSHLEGSSAFSKVLQTLHTAEAKDSNEHFSIPGGCPVKDYQKAASFGHAMETYSLAAIMAQMAQAMGEEYHEDESEGDSQEFTPPTVEAVAQEQQQQAVDPDRPRLSESLKTGTAASHQAAEDVHFVSNFIRGKIDRTLYGKLVLQLYHVYATLEDCLDQHADKHFGSCHFPKELARTAALQEDVDFWHSTTSLPPMSPATADYCDRLRTIAATEPVLLLAHAYTRYLGDLSGGKILARVARKALSLDTPEGWAFYRFEEIKSAKRFKDTYRQALDALPLTSKQIQRTVQEANVAFLLNVRLFEELDVAAGLPGATVRPLSCIFQTAQHDEPEPDAPTECPFLAQKQQQQPSAGKKACPWPFILLHDPATGMRDFRTWALAGILLCLLWSQVV